MTNQPDVIICGSVRNGRHPIPKSSLPAAWTQRDNLYFIPPDLIQRHTPRLAAGAARLCEQLETARGKRPE